MWSRKATDTFLQRAGLALVLLSIIVAAVFFGGQSPREFTGVIGLVLLSGLAWVLRLWAADRPRLFLHPLLPVIAMFLGYAAWRTPQSAVPYLALGELMQLTLYALVFVVALHLMSGREEGSWVVHVLVGLGAILSVYALIQCLNQSDSILWMKQPPGYFKRAGATFVNPNHFAGFLVPLIPLALAQAFVSRQEAWLRVSHGLAAGLLFVGVGVSMSRGGWAVTAVVTVMFLVWLMARRPHLRLPAIGALGLFVIAAAVFISANSKARARLDGVNLEGNIESGLRQYIWQPAWHEFLAHRVWGVGPAQFRVYFPQYRTPVMQHNPGWCHNEYLNLLCDYGLVGAGMAVLGLSVLVVNFIWVRKYAERGGSPLGTKGSDRTALFVGVHLGLFGVALHSFGDFILHTPAVALLTTVLLALSAAGLRHATERFRVSVPPGIPFALLLALGVVGAWLVPKSWNRAREAALLQRAESTPRITPALFANLITAANLEPGNPRTAYEIGENYRRLSFTGGDEWRQQGTNAVLWLERACQLDAHDPFARLKLGLMWRWLGNPEKFQRNVEKAVDLGPNQVEIANHYAWSLLLQGRPRKARVILNDSLSWNMWDNWLARKYLAEIDGDKWPDKEPK